MSWDRFSFSSLVCVMLSLAAAEIWMLSKCEMCGCDLGRHREIDFDRSLISTGPRARELSPRMEQVTPSRAAFRSRLRGALPEFADVVQGDAGFADGLDPS